MAATEFRHPSHLKIWLYIPFLKVFIYLPPKRFSGREAINSLSLRTLNHLSTSEDAVLLLLSGFYYAPTKVDASVLGLAANLINTVLVSGDTEGFIQVWDISGYGLSPSTRVSHFIKFPSLLGTEEQSGPPPHPCTVVYLPNSTRRVVFSRHFACQGRSLILGTKSPCIFLIAGGK